MPSFLLRASISVAAAVLAGTASAQLATTAWPKYMGNLQNTGRGLGSGTLPVIRWAGPDGNYRAYGTPSIGINGKLFGEVQRLDNGDDQFYGLDATNGASTFSTILGNRVAAVTSPAMAADGSMYVILNSSLVSVDTTSLVVNWSKSIGAYSSPTIDSSGRIFCSGSGSKYFAFDSTGTNLWTVTLDANNNVPPCIGSDGTVYMSTLKGTVYALNPSTGIEIWHHTVTNSIIDSIALANGLIYAAGQRGDLNALNTADGSIAWTQSGLGEIDSGVSVGPSGNVLVVSYAGILYSLNGLTGAIDWSLSLPDTFFCAPVVDANGDIYATGFDNGNFYAVDGMSHTLRWSHHIGSAYQSQSPVINGDGTVFASVLYRATDGITAFDTFKSASLSLDSSTVTGGTSTNCTVTLPGTAFADVTVNLRSQNPSYIGVPATVTVPSGSSSVSFPVTTQTYSSNYSLNINASYDGVNKSIPLTVANSKISSVSLPATNAGGGVSVGVVNLATPAPAGGWTVNLSTGNSAYVTVPATVTISAGLTSSTFNIQTRRYPKAYSTSITASDHNSKAASTLNVSP